MLRSETKIVQINFIGGWFVFLLAMILSMFSSCKPSVPARYLQPDQMEDILYDYHIADGMSLQQSDSRSLITYKAAILKKHEVTAAEFDSSMVYYVRHTEQLHDIYERLAERISNEAVALGATAGDIEKYGVISSSSDTANVWNESRAMVLSQYVPFNLSTYSIKADTAYHAGDRMVLNFDTQFIFQDGSRDGIAVLAVTFANDSVATQTVHMSSSNHYSTQVSDDRHIGIKEVKGFFLLNKSLNNAQETSTTLRMMIVSNIHLIRIHERKSMPAEAKPDTLAPDEAQKREEQLRPSISPEPENMMGRRMLPVKQR